MKTSVKETPRTRIELGKHIVADSGICHGKPTFNCSRVMAWQVLEAVERGEPWDQICAAWPHAVTHEAIEETLRLASSVFRDARAVPHVARAAQLAGSV
jgi:uncharacterized protein (DUF433 family)